MKLTRWERPGWPEPFWWGRFEWPELVRWPEHMLTSGFEPDGIKVEEFTDNGTFVVRAELAGLDPEKDVEVDIKNGTLRIRAERRKETKVEDKNFYRSEIHYGAFYRSLPLPPGAKEEDVKATYKSGILEVRVPVAETPAGGTKIPVVQA